MGSSPSPTVYLSPSLHATVKPSQFIVFSSHRTPTEFPKSYAVESEEMAWRGQLSRNLKEIRILFSPNSPSSAPLRAFIENNYKQLKTHNPKLPILIREASSIEPQIWARFATSDVFVEYMLAACAISKRSRRGQRRGAEQMRSVAMDDAGDDSWRRSRQRWMVGSVECGRQH
nr:NADH dehydrogenase [ubiquinone] 1 alpha subcomplex subunit 2-like [Ipomoea batatas]